MSVFFFAAICVIVLGIVTFGWRRRRERSAPEAPSGGAAADLASQSQSSAQLVQRFSSVRHPVTLFSRLSESSSSLSCATGLHYLVTGAHGFVASHLVETLLARGERRITLLDMRDSALFLPERGESESENESDTVSAVKFVNLDLSSATLEQLKQLLSGVDVVFHFAARVDFWKRLPFQYGEVYAANVRATDLLLQASAECGVRKFLFASSIHVVEALNNHGKIVGGDETLPYPPDGQEIGHYGKTKRLAEQSVLRANGHGKVPLATIALRCPGMFGPRDTINLLTSVVNVPRFPCPRPVYLDWCYIGNVVFAFLKAEAALKSSKEKIAGRVYFIQGREVMRLEALGDELRRVLGHTCVWLPTTPFIALAYLMEFVHSLFGSKFAAYFGDLSKLTPVVIRLMSHDSWYSDAAAEKEFGFKPLYTFHEGIEQCKIFFNNLGLKTV